MKTGIMTTPDYAGVDDCPDFGFLGHGGGGPRRPSALSLCVPLGLASVDAR